MTSKKYLKKFAKEDRNSILSESGNLLQKLEVQLAEKPVQNSVLRFKPFWICISEVAGMLLLMFVLFFYPANNHKVKYLDDNFITYESNITELNASLQEFSISSSPSNFLIDVKKTIDSISGDLIYYAAIVQRSDSSDLIKFTYVVNPYYEYKDFQITKKFVRASFSGFPIYYKSNKSFDDEGNIVLSGSACIQTKHESIYITSFSKTLDDPLETFPHAIGEFIKPIS